MSFFDLSDAISTNTKRALYIVAAASIFSILGGCSSAGSTTELGETGSFVTTEACSTQLAGLDQAAVNASSKKFDALLEVISPDCGASFHTAGPSHLDSHRLVRIGSTTKTYVAIVTLQLVAAGKISLDHRVDEYLPDAPAAIAPVTVRQLLQHTSGIYSYTEVDAFWTELARDPHHYVAPRDLVDLALSHDPYFAPGTGWQYSNTNYIILGMMLEHLEGAPIARLIREHILRPNRLDETFFDEGETVAGNLAPGFFAPMDGLTLPWSDGQDVSHAYSLSWAWSAGAMVASLSDTARFIELVGRGALLPPAVQTELTRTVDVAPNLHYGLGVMVLDPAITGGAGPGIGHGGDIMGYHSLSFYFPQTGLTLAGAVDGDHGNPNDSLVGALGVLFPQPADPQPSQPAKPTPSATLAPVARVQRLF